MSSCKKHMRPLGKYLQDLDCRFHFCFFSQSCNKNLKSSMTFNKIRDNYAPSGTTARQTKKQFICNHLSEATVCRVVCYKSTTSGAGDGKLTATYELYQLKVSQLRPSSWYSLSVLPFLYSLEASSCFQSAAGGRSYTQMV